MLGGLAPRPFPDYARLSHRKYGHRVGLFRLLDVLEKHGLQATVAMDALTAEPYPYVVRHDLQRGCEIIGHGLSASRMSTRTMSESAERDDIQTAMETLARATVPRPLSGHRLGHTHAPPWGVGGQWAQAHRLVSAASCGGVIRCLPPARPDHRPEFGYRC